ncbi:MAG: hypothetical protein Q4D20_07975 [Clostridia bacterium]|nr:hypothetical protein [Clostridia bacterium]
MKKVLSVFLAILMMFAAVSVGSFAADTDTSTTVPTVTPVTPYHDWWKNGVCNDDQAVVTLLLNSGTLKGDYVVYDETLATFKTVNGKDISGSYSMVPTNSTLQVAGEGFVILPAVTPGADTYQFDGWRCTRCQNKELVGQTFAANSVFNIPAGTGGTEIQLMAAFSPKEVDVPTLTKVVGILAKVFGTIYGLLTGDVEAGIATVEALFKNIFG